MIERRGSLRRLFHLVVPLSLFAGVLSAQALSPTTMPRGTTRAPDEFGTNDYTVTTIGAGSFTAANSDPSYPTYYFETTDFTRHNTNYGTDAHYYATVSVPAGAVIDYVGLNGSCSAAAITGVALNLVDRHGNVTPLLGFSCTAHSIDTDYNSSALGYQLIRNVQQLLMLDVEINDDAIHFGTFTWVEIWWKRTVSPAPGTADFGDVPTSSPQFQFIEALYHAGITVGCGGGNYCPNNPVTRGQMAVFLAKALGLHWPL